MGRVHLEAVRRVGTVDVVAIAGRRLEAAQSLAAAYGVERVETDYRRILDDSSIDAVHVCTPNASTRRFRSRPWKPANTFSAKSL